MTYLTESDVLTFPSPLGTSDFNFAREFSKQQKDPDKARQVYLNTLAVRAVNFYCHDLLKLETELEKSQSWDKNTRFLMDVADLKVKGLGTLECRPVLKGEKVCHIPSEVRTDRIGYVIVEIDEKAKTGTLINFVKTVEEKEELPLAYLPDIEGLIDLLLSEESDISEPETAPEPGTVIGIAAPQTKTKPQSQPDSVITEGQLSDLRQQLEALFSEEWDAPDKVLASSSHPGNSIGNKQSPSSENTQNFTSEITVRKAKSIKLKDREFALIIKIEQNNDQQLQIVFEVKPQLTGLPAGLELALLSPSGKKITSNKAEAGDRQLQIPRNKPASMQLEKLQNLIKRGKFYQIELTLEGKSYIDNFPSNLSSFGVMI